MPGCGFLAAESEVPGLSGDLPAWLHDDAQSGRPARFAELVREYGAAIYLFATAQISWLVLLPFVLNLVFNATFTPVQFKLRNNVLALVDIVLVLFTLIWALVSIYPFAPWITWVNILYLLWVGFATALQSNITWLNR